ncbi:hypothetical protein [Methanoregula sp.]|uniref:hypothetical protein n=1 Tax=Methanoregula sp. TaxID=2052170 RepID=UPI003C4FF06C
MFACRLDPVPRHGAKPSRVRFTPSGPIHMKKITESDWQRTIQLQCIDARPVRGGTNCTHPTGTGYCYFKNCPKVSLP